MAKKKKTKAKEVAKRYRIGGSRASEGAITGGLIGAGIGGVSGQQAIKRMEKAFTGAQSAYYKSDPKLRKVLKNMVRSSHMTPHTLNGLLWGMIIGSAVPRTKKFTKKEVSEYRKGLKNKSLSKKATYEENIFMDNKSKADIVFEKNAGKAKKV